MSDARQSTHTASDDDSEPFEEEPCRSILPGDPYLQPTNQMEESDPEEEPFEEEEESQPISPVSSHPVPSPTASPSASASPIPSPPNVPPTSIPNPPPPAALLWDWMPKILDWWRRDEQIPILPPITEPPTPIPPLTKEAVHETVPVLITRLRSHERILEWLDKKVKDKTDAPAQELEELHQQVLGVQSELLELRDDVVTNHNEGIELKEEVEALSQRVLSAEDRALAAENRAQRLESQMNAMGQEIIALRAEGDQLRETTLYATRMVDRLERLCERIR